MWRRLFFVLLLIPVVLLGLGWLGFLHPMFDSISVFRQPLLWISLVALVLFLFLRAYRLCVLTAIICIMSSGFLWQNGNQQLGEYAHYQKNMSFRMKDQRPLAKDIVASNASFVTLQEVDDNNLAILKLLQPEYKSAHFCEFEFVGGTAVLSKFAKIAGTERCYYGATAMQVATDQGLIWLISIHLHWPWPHAQEAQAIKLLDELTKLEGPKIIGGDFNMVTWSHRLREISQKTGTKLLNGTYRSFALTPFFNIPIDHILAPSNTGSGVQIRPLLGSDHLGLLGFFNI